MPLREPDEIKHVLLTNSMENLNSTVAQFVAQGWEVLSAELFKADPSNEVFQVFYIFIRRAKRPKGE